MFCYPDQIVDCRKKVIYCFQGVERRWKKVLSGKDTLLTAHVKKIWFSVPGTFGITPWSLITFHDMFAPASIILKSNVHLLSIASDIVQFIELDPDVNILDVTKNPILLIAQTQQAKKIIALPRKVFDKLVFDFDIGEHEVVWLFHTNRCGSTLWAQIFHTVPGWTIISETQVLGYSLSYSSSLHTANIDSYAKTEEFEEMIVSYIKAYLHIVPAQNSVLWRALGFMSEHMIPIIQKRFPKHKIMFVYRDVLPSAKSYHKVMGKSPLYEETSKVMYKDLDNPQPEGLSRRMRLFWTSGYDPAVCIPAIKASQLQANIFELFMVLWGTRVKKMQEHQQNGITIHCISYDQLINNPRLTISKVFNHVSISGEFVNGALKAMKSDSQAGLVFSKVNKDCDPGWVRTPGAVQRCNLFLAAMGLPSLDSPLVMNNTL